MYGRFVEQVAKLANYQNNKNRWPFRPRNPGERLELNGNSIDYRDSTAVNAILCPSYERGSLFYAADRENILLGILREHDKNSFVINQELASSWPKDVVAKRLNQGIVARLDASRIQLAEYVKDVKRYIASMPIFEEAAGITYNLPNVIGVSITDGPGKTADDIQKVSNTLIYAYHIPRQISAIQGNSDLSSDLLTDMIFVESMNFNGSLPENLVRDYAFYQTFKRLGLSYLDQMNMKEELVKSGKLGDLHSFNKASRKAEKEGVLKELDNLLNLYYGFYKNQRYFPIVG